MGFVLSLPYPAPGLVPTEMFDDGGWWHGIEVETASSGAAIFTPNPSVYARGVVNPDSVHGAFLVGITNPPQLQATRDTDLINQSVHRQKTSDMLNGSLHKQKTSEIIHEGDESKV